MLVNMCNKFSEFLRKAKWLHRFQKCRFNKRNAWHLRKLRREIKTLMLENRKLMTSKINNQRMLIKITDTSMRRSLRIKVWMTHYLWILLPKNIRSFHFKNRKIDQNGLKTYWINLLIKFWLRWECR